MSKNYGYIQPVIKPEDYKFGASPLPQKPLVEDGQWLKWVPDFEPQSKGFDTFSCVAFGNLNIIEMLGKRISELDENFSERFVAINGNIRPPGSSPTEISEVIRKQGIIYEKLLPWSDDLATLDEWRSFKNANEQLCRKKGLEWVDTFSYMYEIVPTDLESLKSALRFSPVGVAVSAWYEDSKQQFYSPPGVPSNHWCVLIGYTDDYWLIFDSYSDDGVPFKHLRKDYNFGFAMRFNLELKESIKKKLNLLERLLLTLKQWLNLLPATPVKPVESIIMDTPKPKYDWSTKANARHSARVIMDEYKISWGDKNLLCAVIEAESNFNPKAVNHNRNRQGFILSTDYGICQINDHYWIGPNKTFKSVEEVLNEPDKSIRFMIEMFKANKLNLWIAYKNKSYLKYLT